MRENSKEETDSLTDYENILNNLAALDVNDREKVSIFIQGMMATRDKKTATA